MTPSKPKIEPIYPFEFAIPDEAVDENGHVNNVIYVQWMQDAAIRHYEAMSGTQPTQAIGSHLGGTVAHDRVSESGFCRRTHPGTDLGSQFATSAVIASLSICQNS